MEFLLALLIAVSPDARQHAEHLAAQAKTHREAGDFKAALDEAQHAFFIWAKPALLLEIAQDQAGLGKWAEAVRFYQRYLGTKPKGANRALAEKGLADAQAHASPAADPLALAPLTPGAAPSAPAPAPAPTPAPAPAEANPLEATPLVEAPAAPVAEAAKPAPTLEPPVQPPPIIMIPEATETETKPHSRVLAYSLIGVGAAAAVFAVIGWVEVAQYNSYVGSLKPGASGHDALGQQSSANTWQDVAIATSIAVGLSGGGVALTW